MTTCSFFILNDRVSSIDSGSYPISLHLLNSTIIMRRDVRILLVGDGKHNLLWLICYRDKHEGMCSVLTSGIGGGIAPYIEHIGWGSSYRTFEY